LRWRSSAPRRPAISSGRQPCGSKPRQCGSAFARECLGQLRTHAPRDTALEHSLDAAVSVLAADCANIQLVHPRGPGLALRPRRGSRPASLVFLALGDARQSACGVAWQERRPVVVEDVLSSRIFEHTQALEVLLEAGVRAVKSIPLLKPNGQPLGMLS